MNVKYKIRTPGGNENLVNGVAELQRLYLAGQIKPDVLIRPTSGDQWYPLNELFNLAGWEANATAIDAHGHAPPPPDITPATNYGARASGTSELQNPSIRGMRAAGCLIIVNAAIFIGSIALFGYHPSNARYSGIGSKFLIAVCVIDIVVGCLLLIGRWRRFALVRACLGALYFGGQIANLDKHTTQQNLTTLFQLFIVTGFIILLSDEFISVVRMILGVGAVVFAWIGMTILTLVFTFPAAKHSTEVVQPTKEIQPNTKPPVPLQSKTLSLLERELQCYDDDHLHPAKVIMQLQRDREISRRPYISVDSETYFRTTKRVTVWGLEVYAVFGWQDGSKLFVRGPGTASPITIGVVIAKSPDEVKAYLKSLGIEDLNVRTPENFFDESGKMIDSNVTEIF